MRYLVVVLVVVAIVAGAALAQRVSPDNPASATSETLSPLVETDGWCVSTNGTTTVQVDTAAPARLTTVKKSRVRWMQLKFFAGTSSTRVCHMLGGTLPATSCDALDADAVGVLTDGQTATYAVARDRTAGGLPSIQVQANAGTDGRVCVVVGW